MIYDGAEMLVEAFQSFPSGKTKVKCTGIAEKFNPGQESCQAACARACAEELKFAVAESGACRGALGGIYRTPRSCQLIAKVVSLDCSRFF